MFAHYPGLLPENSMKSVRRGVLRTGKLNRAVWKNSCVGPLTLRPSGGHTLGSHTGLPPQARSSSPSFPEVRAPRTNNRTTDVSSTAYHADRCAVPPCSGTRFASPVVGSCPQTFQHHQMTKNTQSGHTDRFSNLQRKRWTPKENMSREDPADCTLYLANKRESQAQSIGSARTVTSK